MSIGKYIASLLPSFTRSRLEEDISVLLEDVYKNTIPPYENGAEFFKYNKFTSKDNKDFDKIFMQKMKNVKFDRSVDISNYVGITKQLLNNAYSTLVLIDDNLDKYFNTDISAGGLSFTRVNLIRFVEVCHFFNKYARKLLLWTYAEENTGMGIRLSGPFSKGEISWLVDNRNHFLYIASVLANKPEVLFKNLVNIPEIIVVPEEVDMVEKTVGLSKLDPLSMNLIPVKLNPIYHIGLTIAEWQAARYHAGIEEKRALEFRLLSLKDFKEGKEDAKLQQEIEYTENRLRKLNFKLAKMEEE